MITDLEQYRNNVSELSDLEDTRYENIFKLAKDDKHFFYNIIKKIKFDDDINPDYYYEIRANGNMPWTTLSQQVYGTQDLWWLICSVNKILNPINNPKPGEKYKIIKPDLVSTLLNSIKNQL